MVKIRFSGTVQPDAVKITVQNNPVINWKDTDGEDTEYSFKISITNSVVSIECDANKFDPRKHVERVYMRAFDLARATVDLVAFNTGYGFTVILNSYTDPHGVTTPFIPSNPKLAALCTAYKMGDAKDFDPVLRIVCSDWRIAHALHWLIESNTVPHIATVNCARAVEGLRTIVAPPNAPRGKAWGILRDTLNLSEPYLKAITDISVGGRHADYVHVPGPAVADVHERAWIIMNRFLEYRKRNSGKLPLADFPLL